MKEGYKMILNIYDKDKKLVNTINKNVEYLLLESIYNKYILKSKEIRQVQYQYNYNDKQKVTFIWCNGSRQVFSNIPTKWRLFRYNRNNK